MSDVAVTIAVFVFLVIPGVVSGAESSCPVAGNTARWTIAYCMARFETDDGAHPDVTDCFLAEWSNESAETPEENCDANVAYKSAICAIMIEWDLYGGTLASCIASEETVPSVVKNGVE